MTAAPPRILREARRAFGRFRNTGPADLARSAWRAVQMTRSAPISRRSAERAERVVVCLSTVPGRAGRLAPVLRSLLDQSEPADAILLALPERTRAGLPYPSPSELCLPDGIQVIGCDDHGPATKLLPALRHEPDAVLVVVDDDVIYPRGMIETLLGEHRARPDAALGCRGVRLAPGVPFAALDHVFATGVAAVTPVDVLFGTWGYLIPPAALGPEVHELAAAPEEMRWVDDVWISGHLARRGIGRFVVPGRGLPIETLASFRDALTFGVNRSGRNDEIALNWFARDW